MCGCFAEGLGPLGLEVGRRFRKEGKHVTKSWGVPHSSSRIALLVDPDTYSLFSLKRGG